MHDHPPHLLAAPTVGGYETPTGGPCPHLVRVDGTVEGSGACSGCGTCLFGLEWSSDGVAALPPPMAEPAVHVHPGTTFDTPTGRPCPHSVRVDGTVEGSGACWGCGTCLFGLDWLEPMPTAVAPPS